MPLESTLKTKKEQHNLHRKRAEQTLDKARDEE